MIFLSDFWQWQQLLFDNAINEITDPINKNDVFEKKKQANYCVKMCNVCIFLSKLEKKTTTNKQNVSFKNLKD